MQLGQVLGLFFLPGGRLRLLLVFDTSAGSDLRITISSGTDSVVDSMGTDIEVGTSCGNSAGEEAEGSETSCPSMMNGVLGISSRGEVVGKVIGSSCSLSKTWGANSDTGSLANSS